MGTAHRIQSQSIRQSEVQKDDIDRVRRKVRHRLTQALDLCHFENSQGLITKHRAQEQSVSGVVLDQQHLNALLSGKNRLPHLIEFPLEPIERLNATPLEGAGISERAGAAAAISQCDARAQVVHLKRLENQI